MTFNIFNPNNKYFHLLAAGAALISPLVMKSNCLASDLTTLDNTEENIIVASHLSNTKVLPATINLVKQYEGFRSAAYIDTSGLPVIGYGQSKLNGKTVRMGQYVTQAQADAELAQELYHIQLLVHRFG